MMTRGLWQDVSVCKVLAAKTSDLNWSLGLKWWKEEMDFPNLFVDLNISSLACVYGYVPRQIINTCFQRVAGGRDGGLGSGAY